MPKFIKNKDIQEQFDQLLEIIENDWSLNLERQLLDIREKISQQMEKRDLSRADLAKILNSSRSYVTQLLSGNENIRLSTLFKVAFALGLKPVIQFRDEEMDFLRDFSKSDTRHINFKNTLEHRTFIVTTTSKVIEEEYELA